jgi:beta-mannosidase
VAVTRRLAPGLLLAAVVFGCGPSPSVTRVPLHDGWEFRRVGEEEWRPATVPGTVHTDLLANGEIEDPFYRDNEFGLQWIEREDWEYRTTIDVGEALLEEKHVELVFEGLDTYADVLVNGSRVLRTDNMFRGWEQEVRRRLNAGQNELVVRFRSPIEMVLPVFDMMDSLGMRLPAGNDRGEKPTRVYTRKAAYHYGWDWGPRFVTSGIWRPVTLRAWSGVRISDVQIVQQSLSDERAVMRAYVEIRSDSAQPAAITVRSRDRRFNAVSVEARLPNGRATASVDFVVEDPERWWPNGIGDQQLYDIEVEVRAGDVRDRVSLRAGLRTLEVVNEPDSIGESFYVRVNGVPVFMKGANYIPLDHFTPRVDEQRYRTFFEAAVQANMNMLRVWGGGIYENDLFYDLADEYGILIWQDFMFANGMYPHFGELLDGIAQEAVENIRRLRNHPSLALWCGNNEMDEGWHNWGWQRDYASAQAERIWSTYRWIFHQMLPELVATYDSGRFYWPSSPSIGWGHPESMTHGDSHYWGVWHGREPFEVLQEKLPRFMSEFGFQGYPSLETVAAFTLPEDRDVDSPVMLAHQKHPVGPEIVREYMGRWYREPNDFASFLYLSQLVQAEGMRLAFESQRRAMPRTMGTLYWQLNDTWPVASWSSLDYFGRWKALHYAARDAFAPVLVSPVVRGDTVDVYVVSDRLEPVHADLELRLLEFDGTIRWDERVTVDAPANSSVRVFAEEMEALLGGAARSDVVLQVRLLNGAGVMAENLLYFVPPKDLDLSAPDVEVQMERGSDGPTLLLSTDRLAKHVYLSLDDGDAFFLNNFFDLIPGHDRRVLVESEMDAAELSERLRVRTLTDTY